MTKRDETIQKISKAAFVVGLIAFFPSKEIGCAILAVAVGLYIYRPY